MEFVRRGRKVRRSMPSDSAFRDYRAEARGYVYFFLDRPDTDERTLVKVDQVALELYWRAPGWTHQRIAGLRDRRVLPTNVRYHLDHLTVVQDDFGDWIRMGDGDEVARVLHPLGPGSEAAYDFLLADSLTIRYGAGAGEVRVYEVRVRPRAPELPGFVGSVFLDRETAAIVRMGFTFTPASYVDPRVDYIRVALDNALWLGKYWLPRRQEAEVRRESPVLDLLAGSVIRARFEIGGYAFNEGVPVTLSGPFPGARPGSSASRPVVTWAPPPERAAFPFERELFDDLDERGLAPPPSLEEVRVRAREIAADRALSGLTPWRVHWGSFSEAARFDRAEGLRLGVGAQLRSRRDERLRLAAGWAFEREKPSAVVAVTGRPGTLVPEVEAYWDQLRDLGPRPGAAGAVNSLAAAALDEDYLDPWFARGARFTLRGGRPGTGPALTLRLERHRAARNVVEGGLRPVRPIEEGSLGSATLLVPFGAPSGGEAFLEGGLSSFDGRTFPSVLGRSTWTAGRSTRRWSVEVDASAGFHGSDAPVQRRFALGGRATIPGHRFRELTGTRFGLLRVAATRPLASPWLGVRALAAVGGTHLPDGAREPPAGALFPDAAGRRDDGGRASLGAGLSLLWDVLFLDLDRGFGGDGEWALSFSVTSRFHPWL